MLRRTTLTALLFALALTSHAQVYYLMSEMTNGVLGAPWPMNPCASCPTYFEGNGIYWVNDRSQTANDSLASASMTASEAPIPSDGSDTNGTPTNFNPNVSIPDVSYLTNGSLFETGAGQD